MKARDIIHERYELGDPLGKGGMAEVWRARDPHLDRPVAVKFLAPQLANDPEFLVRFFAEAQAVARISHPNVVKVLDFGEHQGSPFLVMEAVEGGALTELVGQPIAPERALEIVAGAAAAAGAAHDAGIVHRDIKPGNILMDADGGAKLADFGIASSGRSERLTATGAAIGSPHYISPEQATGSDATPASDVYSLGIVLYELLTGVRPFDGDNVTAIAIAQVEQQPAPPSTHVPEVAALDGLVLRCLSKDPRNRFADGRELAATLQHFDPSARVGVVEETVDPHWWATRRGLVAVAAAVALVAVPVVVFAGGDRPEESASASEEAGFERLPDVGGLDVTPTPSQPSRSTQVSKPTPSPSETEEERKKKSSNKTSAGSGASDAEDPESEEPDPEPTPEPTEEPVDTEPTPEPSPSP